IAKPNGGLSFDADEIALELNKAPVARGMDVGLFFRQIRQAVPVMEFQVIEDFGEVGPVILAGFLQMTERRFQNDAPRLFFFGVPARCSGKAERADQRRQGESLKYKRNQDDAEREKDDQLALRKRRPIRQRLWQRNRGCERDDAAHAGPADDEDLARRGQRLPLVKRTSADEIRQARAGKNPYKAQQDEKRAEESAIH